MYDREGVTAELRSGAMYPRGARVETVLPAGYLDEAEFVKKFTKSDFPCGQRR
jgi:hypothetical protein